MDSIRIGNRMDWFPFTGGVLMAGSVMRGRGYSRLPC
jgi:hypothetical protein